MNQELSPFGLRPPHYWVLAVVCTDPHLSQRELADFLDLRPSQIVSVINRLQEYGAVVRKVDAQDRRSNVVSATAKGRQLYEVTTTAVEKAERNFLSRLTETDRIDLRRLLRHLLFAPP